MAAWGLLEVDDGFALIFDSFDDFGTPTLRGVRIAHRRPTAAEAAAAVASPSFAQEAWPGSSWELLPAEEVAELGLPDAPPWHRAVTPTVRPTTPAPKPSQWVDFIVALVGLTVAALALFKLWLRYR